MKWPLSNAPSAVREWIISELPSGLDDREKLATANWLLEDLKRSPWAIQLAKDMRYSESELNTLKAQITELNTGKPLQYVLGYVPFYNLKLAVNPHTLIPRPETEELVDLVVHSMKGEESVLDIGTGSGCIALAIKQAHEQAEVHAVDISTDALEVAKQNAQNLHLEVKFHSFDVLKQELPFFPDILVSNPPYVLESEKGELADHVIQFEPHLALFVADSEPLLFYHRIKSILMGADKEVRFFLECHEKLAMHTADLFDLPCFVDVEIVKDAQQKTRFVKGLRIAP